jgi:hypothetical protein
VTSRVSNLKRGGDIRLPVRNGEGSGDILLALTLGTNSRSLLFWVTGGLADVPVAELAVEAVLVVAWLELAGAAATGLGCLSMHLPHAG